MARLRLGKDHKLYRNTGTEETPVWNEMPNIRDLSLNLDMGEAECSIRGVDVELTEPTLQKVGLEFETVKDLDDTDVRTMTTAYFTRSALDLAIADGPIAEGAQEYMRGVLKCFSRKNAQPLQGVSMLNWIWKPCFSLFGFRWVTVSGTTTTTTTTQAS